MPCSNAKALFFRAKKNFQVLTFWKNRNLVLKTQVLVRFSFLTPFWYQGSISSSWIQFWVKNFFLAFFRAEKRFFKNVEMWLQGLRQGLIDIFEKSFFGSKKRKKKFFDPKPNPGAGNTHLIPKWGQKWKSGQNLSF